MGASFGVSLVTTLLVRDSQRHQDLLVGHLTPLDPPFHQLLNRLEQFMALKPGIAPPVQRAYGLIYGMLHQQASLLAYVDDFRLLGILTLCCVPFLFLFRGVKKSRSQGVEKSKS